MTITIPAITTNPEMMYPADRRNQPRKDVNFILRT
jgi:hypothetical protein